TGLASTWPALDSVDGFSCRRSLRSVDTLERFRFRDEQDSVGSDREEASVDAARNTPRHA
ncbi:MAG: hypothetical protein RIF41_00205, partial [Polyangiaceae bacterium]